MSLVSDRLCERVNYLKPDPAIARLFPEIGDNPNAWIQTISKALEGGDCAITIRKLIEVHAAYIFDNGEATNSKSVMAILCCPFDLSWWCAKSTLRTVCLVCCIPVACAEENKYEVEGRVKQTLVRTREDWRTTIAVVAASFAHIVSLANKESAGDVARHLLEHNYPMVLERKRQDAKFKAHVEAYAYWWDLARERFKAEQPPPNKQETIGNYLKALLQWRAGVSTALTNHQSPPDKEDFISNYFKHHYNVSSANPYSVNSQNMRQDPLIDLDAATDVSDLLLPIEEERT